MANCCSVLDPRDLKLKQKFMPKSSLVAKNQISQQNQSSSNSSLIQKKKKSSPNTYETNINKARNLLQNPPISVSLSEKYFLTLDGFENLIKIFIQNEVPAQQNIQQANFFKTSVFLESRYPFTPEAYYLFDFQLTLEKFKQLYPFVEEYEIMNQAFQNNAVVFLTKIKTKKFLFKKHYQFFCMRIIQRKNEHEFIEYQQNQQLQKSTNEKQNERKLSSTNNQVQIIDECRSVSNKNQQFTNLSYFLSSIFNNEYLINVSENIKDQFQKYFLNYQTLNYQFLKQKQDFDKLNWFSKNKNDIQKIFDDNQETVNQFNFKSDQIDKLLIEMNQQQNNLKELPTNKKQYSYQEQQLDEEYNSAPQTQQFKDTKEERHSVENPEINDCQNIFQNKNQQ